MAVLKVRAGHARGRSGNFKAGGDPTSAAKQCVCFAMPGPLVRRRRVKLGVMGRVAVLVRGGVGVDWPMLPKFSKPWLATKYDKIESGRGHGQITHCSSARGQLDAQCRRFPHVSASANYGAVRMFCPMGFGRKARGHSTLCLTLQYHPVMFHQSRRYTVCVHLGPMRHSLAHVHICVIIRSVHAPTQCLF